MTGASVRAIRIYVRWRWLNPDDPLKCLTDMSVVKVKAILDLFQLLVRQRNVTVENLSWEWAN